MAPLANVKISTSNYFVDRIDGTGKSGDTYVTSHPFVKANFIFFRKKNPNQNDKPVIINFNATSAGAGECTITTGGRSLVTGANIVIPTDNELTVGYWGNL